MNGIKRRLWWLVDGLAPRADFWGRLARRPRGWDLDTARRLAFLRWLRARGRLNEWGAATEVAGSRRVDSD